MTDFRRKPEKASLKDLLEETKRDLKLEMNCHAIGIVDEFNPENQTLKARVAYKKTYYEKRGKNYEKVLVDYPFLIDCPMVVISGGPFSLKMPIRPGDECLILFNDRSIDKWFESGSVVELDSNRLHSFSDGIALVGVRSLSRSIENYENDKIQLGDENNELLVSTVDAQLRSDDGKVRVRGGRVNVSNDQESLRDILSDLINAINGITFQYVGAGQGATVQTTGGPDNASDFVNIVSRLGSLLE